MVFQPTSCRLRSVAKEATGWEAADALEKEIQMQEAYILAAEA